MELIFFIEIVRVFQVYMIIDFCPKNTITNLILHHILYN